MSDCHLDPVDLGHFRRRSTPEGVDTVYKCLGDNGEYFYIDATHSDDADIGAKAYNGQVICALESDINIDPENLDRLRREMEDLRLLIDERERDEALRKIDAIAARYLLMLI
jgi:hypothetical protein